MAKMRPDYVLTNLPSKNAIFELNSFIESMLQDNSLYDETNYEKRSEVIDSLDFLVLGQIEELQDKTDQPEKLEVLKLRAEQLKEQLEEIDNELFGRLRADIQKNAVTAGAFRKLIDEYFVMKAPLKEATEESGYDNLDLFLTRLFCAGSMPSQTKDLEPGMIYYQKTPARLVFELVNKSNFSQDDIFVDLGSGLGQVVLLVSLLAGISAIGVEFEPAYCQYARACAKALHLSKVIFYNVDAREADYSIGTVFFLFTPFMNEMLEEVLEHLKKQSMLRKIQVISYGPCTAQIATHDWLTQIGSSDTNIYALSYFWSR